MDSYADIDMNKTIKFFSLNPYPFKAEGNSNVNENQFGALAGYVVKNYTEYKYVKRNLGIDSEATNNFDVWPPKIENLKMDFKAMLL